MKALLTAIKARLQDSLSGVRDRDVFITEDENLIPAGLKFPAVGIKDGPVARKRAAGDLWERTSQVSIIPWVRLTKEEAAIMGGAGSPGVLDLTSSIRAVLDGNTLDIAGMQDAECYSEQGSSTFGDEREALQRKIITFTYMQDEV